MFHGDETLIRIARQNQLTIVVIRAETRDVHRKATSKDRVKAFAAIGAASTRYPSTIFVKGRTAFCEKNLQWRTGTSACRSPSGETKTQLCLEHVGHLCEKANH
jgi:hypothetical protein